MNNEFVVRSLPVRLYVSIHNNAKYAINVRAHPDQAHAFEMTDETGKTTTLKRK